MMEVYKPFHQDMTHDEAVAYLKSFAFWCRYQTEGLIDSRAIFVAVRSLMCDFDFLGALYGGFDGSDTAKKQNRFRFLRLFREVVARATNNHASGKYAPHLYDSSRVGSVHLGTPRRLTNPNNSTPILTWSLLPSQDGVAEQDHDGRPILLAHLQTVRQNPKTVVLPICVPRLFEDFNTTCEFFAGLLQTEKTEGGCSLLERWRLTALVLATPEPSRARW